MLPKPPLARPSMKLVAARLVFPIFPTLSYFIIHKENRAATNQGLDLLDPDFSL